MNALIFAQNVRFVRLKNVMTCMGQLLGSADQARPVEARVIRSGIRLTLRNFNECFPVTTSEITDVRVKPK